LGGKKEQSAAALASQIRSALDRGSIVLVGMPGSGKSAVGRRLAPRLGLSFFDADEEIERAAGKPIVDIFKDHGEAYFRDGERKVIARLLASGPQVLATGGGAFMTAETRENIHRSGISVWLKAELGLLVRRVLKKGNRPLLAGDPEGALQRLMQTRDPIYALADITVESRDVPHDAIVGDIIEALRKSLLGEDCKGPGQAAVSKLP
jgi:shikimate kinase